MKELHYFDKPHVRRTILDAHERSRAKLAGLSSPRFWLRYWVGARSDDWYARLFASAQRRGRLAGEITPAYATLDAASFERLRRINPALRIVFVLRDPVARAWSAVNHAFEKRGGVPGTLGVAEAIAAARRPAAAARSDYLGTLRRLEDAFPRAQIHCASFEDLRDEPERFTRELLAFLGVDAEHVHRMRLPRAVNAGALVTAIPEEFAREMGREYAEMLGTLAERLSS